MTNRESHIQNISRSCNEPEVFLKWRLSMLEYAEKLSEEILSYGLGIAPVVPRVTAWDVSELAYAYQWRTSSEQGVRVMRWPEAIKENSLSEKIFALFETQKEAISSNHFFALSAALFSDGVVIFVDEGVSVDIVLETKIPASGADMLFVFAGARSRVAVHETFSFAVGNTADVKGRTVFVVAEEESRVAYAEKLRSLTGGLFFINRKAFTKKGAHVSLVEASGYGAGFLKSETAVFLEGKKSKANLVAFAETDGTAGYDALARVFHRADDTVSNIFSVGTASGLSKIIYRSLIQVPKDIHGGAGRQEGNFLMLSSGAEIDAIPSLEVASDDTKTSHAISVRRLSADRLFYPRTRGFPSRDAESLIVRGLMEDALLAALSGERADSFSIESLFA